MKYSERYYQTYLNQILMKVLLDILVMCLSTIPFNKHFHTLQSIDIENNNIFLSASLQKNLISIYAATQTR